MDTNNIELNQRLLHLKPIMHSHHHYTSLILFSLIAQQTELCTLYSTV